MWSRLAELGTAGVSRYFVRPQVHGKSHRPRADWLDDDNPLLPNLECDDHEAIETGICDLNGDPFMRAPNPMGFGRDGEW